MAKLTTGERMMAIETKVDTIQSDIGDIKKDLKETNSNINKFIQCAPEKFAQKIIETEFKQFQKYTDQRMDGISLKLASYGGAIALLIIILQVAVSTGFFNRLFGVV